MLEVYLDIPVVTRTLVTAMVGVVVLQRAGMLSPFDMYLNWRLVQHGQLWRLVSSFFFLGVQPVPLLLHLFFTYRYSRMLEEGVFRGQWRGYAVMALFGGLVLLGLQWALTTAFPPLLPRMLFLGPSYSIFILYVWAKFHADVRMNLFGLLPFSAPWFPYVIMAFGVVFGSLDSVVVDLCGIVAGHLYYFVAVVYPLSSGRNPLRTRFYG